MSALPGPEEMSAVGYLRLVALAKATPPELALLRLA
jgi:hypothetical protein